MGHTGQVEEGLCCAVSHSSVNMLVVVATLGQIRTAALPSPAQNTVMRNYFIHAVQAFKACQAGLMLNVDVCTSAFLKAAPVPKIMAELLDFR